MINIRIPSIKTAIVPKITKASLSWTFLAAFMLVCAGNTVLIPKSYADTYDPTCPTQQVWDYQTARYFYRSDKFCINAPDGSGIHLTWQSDGNLVAYNYYGDALWASGTQDTSNETTSGVYLGLTKSGSVAVFNNVSGVAWSNEAYKYAFVYGTYYLTIHLGAGGTYGYLNEHESNGTTSKDIWRKTFPVVYHP